MPGTPATLSLVSPTSASTSTTCCRRDAELLDHPVGVEPGAVLARVVDADAGLTSWKKSLSIDTIATSKPSATARCATVPITSSASYPARGQDRHAHRFARLVHPVDLLGEVVGHGGAIGLVVGRRSRRGTSVRRDRTTPRGTPGGDRRSACGASSRTRTPRAWSALPGSTARVRETRGTRGTSASCRRSGRACGRAMSGKYLRYH